MNVDVFTQQLETMYLRLHKLYGGGGVSVQQPPDLLPQVFKELGTASEELQVAIEELRQQNEELVATNQALAEERQRYQDLFDFAPDAYLVTDAQGIIREANRAASTLLNLSPKYLVGKPLLVFLAEEESQIFCSRLKQLHQLDRLQNWQVRLRPRKGEPFDAVMTLNSVRNHEGQPVVLRWLLRNISGGKQPLKALESNDCNPSDARPRHFYSKGESIPLNDESIWLVCQGLVKLSAVSEAQEVVVGLAGSQMPFGNSLTSLETYQATALSKKVQLVSISLKEIAASPSLAQALLPKINRRLQQTESFLAISGQRRVIDRLQHLLLLLKQEFGQPIPQGTRLSVRLTHNELASACCTTRVTMTRLLGKLQQKGMITFDHKNHIIILDNQ